MPTKLFVNLPVKDLGRSKAFFTELGLAFFGQDEDMASVIISEHTQVMLLTESVFASYARRGVVDATAGTEMILVLGVETRDHGSRPEAEVAAGLRPGRVRVPCGPRRAHRPRQSPGAAPRNRHDVTSWWSGARRCRIVAVSPGRPGRLAREA